MVVERDLERSIGLRRCRCLIPLVAMTSGIMILLQTGVVEPRECSHYHPVGSGRVRSAYGSGTELLFRESLEKGMGSGVGLSMGI